MKRLRVGLNGFGRIGRAFSRIAFNNNDFDIVLINTRSTQVDLLAYLLQYDSIYRTFAKKINTEGENLLIEDENTVEVFANFYRA